MTLLEFATKYNTDPNELLELLVFEGFPITTIEDEIDDRLIKYLLEFAGIGKPKSTKKSNNRNHKKNNFKNTKNNNLDKKAFLYESKMTIAECMESTGFSAANIINFFLKKNKLYSINSLLSIQEVVEFAMENNIPLIHQIDEEKKAIVQNIMNAKITVGGNFKRNPIVTIVGHVDHGKTTLLDKIRQDNIAKHEKGGITQHIGAYEIEYNKQHITFLDTPGHEAFNSLRQRGITIADIGVLVVAADDGLKPQTIESIKILQEMQIQIIVAITKVDKKDRKTIDNILNELNQYGILSEAWGGNIPIVEVSAFTGYGISVLIETILLISELSDLKTNIDTNAYGYILETKKDKGLGFISTIILQKGCFLIGDAYYTSSTWGKIIVAYDSNSQKVKKLYPGKPYLINGFSNLPLVGSFIEKTSLQEARKKAEHAQMLDFDHNKKNITVDHDIPKSRVYNIIVKADVSSSLQAIEKSIEKYINDDKFFYKPNIIVSGIGNISENDITMAINANASLYGFNINKVNNIVLLDLIKKNNVKVNNFDIIYELLDHIENEIKEEKNKEPELKKIGEVQVLKLFHIKTIGLIIGFRVLQGMVKLGAIGKVFSNKEYVGKSTIKSLEKEKHQVKELAKGHEGALSLHTFSQVNVNDIIEIYSDKS